MHRSGTIAILVMLAAAGVARGEDLAVVGAWRLLSYEQRELASRATTRNWGTAPRGYLMYRPDGHMSAVLTAEGRQWPAPGQREFHERITALLYSMSAYAGTYTLQGNRVVHHVEVAWLPTWVGSDQPREATLDGDKLTIRTQPIRSPFDGRDYVYVLVWERAR